MCLYTCVFSTPECPSFLLEPLATLYLAFISPESVPRHRDGPGPVLHSSPFLLLHIASKVCLLSIRNTFRSQRRSPRLGLHAMGGQESRAWSLWLEGPLGPTVCPEVFQSGRILIDLIGIFWLEVGPSNLIQVIFRTIMFEKLRH